MDITCQKRKFDLTSQECLDDLSKRKFSPNTERHLHYASKIFFDFLNEKGIVDFSLNLYKRTKEPQKNKMAEELSNSILPCNSSSDIPCSSSTPLPMELLSNEELNEIFGDLNGNDTSLSLQKNDSEIEVVAKSKEKKETLTIFILDLETNSIIVSTSIKY